MAYAINSVDSTVALGYGDAVNSVWGKETIGPTLEYYYSTLDGVSLISGDAVRVCHGYPVEYSICTATGDIIGPVHTRTVSGSIAGRTE